jgi:hypothetical protein
MFEAASLTAAAQSKKKEKNQSPQRKLNVAAGCRVQWSLPY